MKKVARNLQDDTNRGNMSGVKFSIVAANNHYAGFGPGTVNIFRQLIGLEEVKWEDESITIDDLKKDNHEGMNRLRTAVRPVKTRQTSLSDFFQ
jgi:hypothetical protein